MSVGLMLGTTPTMSVIATMQKKPRNQTIRFNKDVGDEGFPSFLPKEVHGIRDPFARSLARRIERVPVKIRQSESFLMSSCVKPTIRSDRASPIVLLHCFDSSCLEWRCVYPLLEEAGLEPWAADILGWGFSDLENLPSCDAASKRYHLYQFWRTYIERPIVLVGPSLGAAVAIDFSVDYPEAVEKLVLINPCVYREGTGNMKKLPKSVAYAGVGIQSCAVNDLSYENSLNKYFSGKVSLLKSIPLRFYANLLSFNSVSLSTSMDWTSIGRLHCLMPGWKDATVGFMASGGLNVIAKIKQVKQKVLIICGEQDQIVGYKLGVRLHCELSDAIIREVPDSGHLPHVEKPNHVAKLIIDFVSRKH